MRTASTRRGHRRGARRPQDRAAHYSRENIDDLCDPGTVVEYGSLVIAAQRRRRTIEDLGRTQTPRADGWSRGSDCVNGDLFRGVTAQCILMSYDYTVLAGTQGQPEPSQERQDCFEIAQKSRLPVVFFTEGGGGRPATPTDWASRGSTAWRSTSGGN